MSDDINKIINLIDHKIKDKKDEIELNTNHILNMVITSIFENVIPLIIDIDPDFSKLSEAELFDLKAQVCGQSAAYIMGLVDRKKELLLPKNNTIITEFTRKNDDKD